MCIHISLELLWKTEELKAQLVRAIVLAGESLKSQVEILISITGITPLSALAFPADIADVTRFKKLKKMSAYPGLVPRADDSGGKQRRGHITRKSRKLTRTILTQSVTHVIASSPYLHHFYRAHVDAKGSGRARIAVIRKLCGIMRRMLLENEHYRWMNRELYEKKLKEYERELRKAREERPAA